MSLVAFAFAPLHRTDECLGAFRYPCLDAEGKTGPAGSCGSARRPAVLLYDRIEARFGARYIV
jgi:hypothetical protein